MTPRKWTARRRAPRDLDVVVDHGSRSRQSGEPGDSVGRELVPHDDGRVVVDVLEARTDDPLGSRSYARGYLTRRLPKPLVVTPPAKPGCGDRRSSYGFCA